MSKTRTYLFLKDDIYGKKEHLVSVMWMRLACSYSKCGRSFSEPIEVTIRTQGSPIETYHACPHCFSRVSDKGTEDQSAPVQVMEMRVEQASLEVLRSIEILSDTEGRHIFDLARMYVPD